MFLCNKILSNEGLITGTKCFIEQGCQDEFEETLSN
jgi:hypothetical protein